MLEILIVGMCDGSVEEPDIYYCTDTTDISQHVMAVVYFLL